MGCVSPCSPYFQSVLRAAYSTAFTWIISLLSMQGSCSLFSFGGCGKRPPPARARLVVVELLQEALDAHVEFLKGVVQGKTGWSDSKGTSRWCLIMMCAVVV